MQEMQRDAGSNPGLGRSPEVGDGNPLQYSCLGNAMDRAAWWATVHGVTKSQAGLSTHTHTGSGCSEKERVFPGTGLEQANMW